MNEAKQLQQRWELSWRADPVARKLADRHYNRQKVGAAQFVPPGACVVLRTPRADAVWITAWPIAEYVKHEWAGAWVNSLFRNENRANTSSELIREAVAATLAVWPEPPALGLVTFVDASRVRHKRDPGRCYRRAGFAHVGYTKSGLLAFQLRPEDMPAASPAAGSQLPLEEAKPLASPRNRGKESPSMGFRASLRPEGVA